MAKLVSKKKVFLKGGYFVNKKGKIVSPAHEVIYQINELETILQKRAHDNANKVELKDPKKFVRDTEFDLPHLKIVTPTLDSKIEDSMHLIEDLESIEINDEINDLIKRLPELMSWLKEDEYIATDTQYERVDTPLLNQLLDDDLLHTDVISVCRLISGIFFGPDATLSGFFIPDDDE